MRSGLRLALLKPAALPVTPLPDPPLPLYVAVVKVYFVSCLYDLGFFLLHGIVV